MKSKIAILLMPFHRLPPLRLFKKPVNSLKKNESNGSKSD